VLSPFRYVMNMRRDGDGRRGVIALAATLLVFVAALALANSPAYAAAPEKKPKPAKAANAKAKPKYKKPKVKGHVKKRVLVIIGTSKGETIVLRLKAGNPKRLQVDVGNNGSAEWRFNRNRFNRIVVFAGGGNDVVRIDEANGVFTDTEATIISGDSGSDDLRGGSGAERFFGGSGKDAVDGNRADDKAFLGFGDDSFTWDPGDGSDTVEGQAGTDELLFNGAGVAERFDVSANGPRVRFFRDVANITMNLDDVERITTNALGGADSAVVNDMRGTDLKNTVFDLEAAIGGNAGDGQPDSVTVNGTNGNDTVNIAANAGAVDVTGLAAAVKVEHSEAANDSLIVNALSGTDTVNAGLGLAALIKLAVDGGANNDTINGGDGNDTLRGGAANDAIDGNRGDDTGLLGAGEDSFTWDPGDGSDKVEGEAGTDTLIFNGAGVAENFDFSANGNRLRFFRNVATITMDVDDTERVDLRALGGIDNTVVNDLSATDVKNIELDLETAIGGGAGDGAVDTTTINGSGGNDAITIAPNAGAVDVTGLAAAVKIEHPEAANDLLNVNGLGGNDTISGSVGLAALIKVAIDGGFGDDTINGGDGNETLRGGADNDAIDGNRGDDTGLLGAGDDSFRWDPGDGSDTVEGEAGTDTLVFNGAGVAENFDISANGQRVRFFRNVANITMDLDDVERILTQALGGVDNGVVNDVSGTDLRSIEFDLEGAIGGGAGDGAADSITVNGTNAPDAVNIAANAGAVDVTGLAAGVRIEHSEAANDLLRVNTLAGNDDVAVGGGVAALVQTLVDLGADG
jgi:Ca2+-binding RTX toxin-like protein